MYMLTTVDTKILKLGSSTYRIIAWMSKNIKEKEFKSLLF